MSSQPPTIGAVHTGTWINWTTGPILGATWTTSPQNGAYLVAFLALFVRVAGQHFWDIFCYTLFQLRSTARDEDGLFHQQQAVLRNTATDTSAVWQFLTLGWYWQRRARRAWGRTLPLVVGGLLNILAFGAAGVFVSRVTNNGNEVLLREIACGLWPDPYAFNPDLNFNQTSVMEQMEFSANAEYTVGMSSTFAGNCYGYDSAAAANLPSPDCNANGRQLIDWSVDIDTACPFAPDMCIDDLAVRLDTGYIDSHLHLGINAPPKNRVLFREVLECAPITIQGFQSGWVDLADSGLPQDMYGPGNYGSEFMYYNYGPQYDYGMNHTFIYSNNSFGSSGSPYNPPNYLVDGEIALLRNGIDGSFLPIPQLNRTDADVNLLFLMKAAYFVSPVNDPWFLAQEAMASLFQNENGSWTNISFYYSRSPVSVLGCTEQFQWCNPNIDGSERCTELTGSSMGSHISAMTDVGKAIKLNQRQSGVQQRIYHALWDSSLFNTAGVQTAGTLLLANAAIQGGTGASLPDDQWVLEVNHFLGTTLSNIQYEMAEYVTGLRNPAHNDFLVQVDTGDTEWMCTNQIVQSNDYASFNICGLVVILVIGTSLITINLSLDRTVRYIRARRGHASGFGNVAWRANDTLNLQSLAFEANGMGDWDRRNIIPVTKNGESFGLPRAASTIFHSEPRERTSGSRWSLPRMYTRKPGMTGESKSLFRNSSKDLISPSSTENDVDIDLPTGDFGTLGFSSYLPQSPTTSRQPPPRYQRISSEASPEITYS